MAIPANVKTKLQSSSHSAHIRRMDSSAANIASSNNVVRSSAARQLDEPSAQQARAIDKILRLPGSNQAN